jgi:hypothetical protein
VLWGIAVVATHAGAWALHWLPGRGRRIDLAHTEIAPEHLIERLRLFFIVALGETVLTMGTAFTDEPFELERLLALAIGFTGTVALWWCYFQREEVGVEVADAAEDAGAVGWWGTWALTLMVLALIAIAVGDELGDRLPRRRRDARVHASHLRRPGALPPRPGVLPLRGAGAPPSVAPFGRRGAGDPRRRHRSAHASRGHRGVDRRARRRGGRGHGRHT